MQSTGHPVAKLDAASPWHRLTVELRQEMSLRLWSAVVGDNSPTVSELRKACQLNLASCYLNTGRTQTVVQLCTDVLAAEPGNRKVLRLPSHLPAG